MQQMHFLVHDAIADMFTSASRSVITLELCCCQGRLLPRSDLSAETLLQMVWFKHLLKAPDVFGCTWQAPFLSQPVVHGPTPRPRQGIPSFVQMWRKSAELGGIEVLFFKAMIASIEYWKLSEGNNCSFSL